MTICDEHRESVLKGKERGAERVGGRINEKFAGRRERGEVWMFRPVEEVLRRVALIAHPILNCGKLTPVILPQYLPSNFLLFP